MSDSPDTAARQAEDLARAMAVAGETDPNSPAPRLAVPAQPTTDELRENAKRALLKRIAEAASDDDSNVHNLGEALRAVEYS